MSDLPVIAITMGAPCGVGPEVVAKALLRSDVRNLCMPLVIGNTSAMEHGASLTGVPLTIHAAQHAGDVSTSPSTISIIDPSNLNYEDVTLGQVSAVAGKASMEWVELAARLSLGGGVEFRIGPAFFHDVVVPLAEWPVSGKLYQRRKNI